MQQYSYFSLFLHFLFLYPISSRRHNVRRHTSICREPLNLKDELATWMQINLEESQFDETILEEWSPNGVEPPICHQSPRVEGKSTIMERALCPWETKVTFEETREPKIITESVCLCRKSRGSSGAFCMPIVRKIPILRRVSCNSKSGYWTYTRSSQMVIVGCHSVLPRTQRAIRLAHLSSINYNIPV